MSSIPWASYFRADHLILHPLLSFFLCRPYITLCPSIVLESYFCALHPLGELFSCRPFNCPIRLSLRRVTFVSSILGRELFPCGQLILHSLASYFNVYHITLHPSIPMSSYFCVIHPLDELFSGRPFNCPICLSLWRVIFVSSIPWASYFRADHLILHPLASFCLYRPYNSPPVHSFGELFLCHPSLGQVIFMLTI